MMQRTKLFERLNTTFRLFLGNVPTFVILLESDLERRHHVYVDVVPKLAVCNIIPATKKTRADEFLQKEKIAVARPMSAAKIACSVSHVRVWNQIVARGLKHAIVLEDDVAILDGFSAFVRELRSQLPGDFDLVHLYVHEDRSEWLRHVGNSQKLYVNYIPVWGRSAYLLSRRGAEKLLAEFRTLTDFGDFQIASMAKAGKLSVYCASRSYLDNLGQLRSEYKGERFRSNVY